MKNERGFTLMEMVISLGVIAIIGSLLVSSIVTINANTKTADLMSFFESITSEAREVFTANPDKVINNSFTPSETSLYPYTDMAYQTPGGNLVFYNQSYTENLHQTTIGSVNEKYRIVIEFRGTDQSTAPGFSFKTKRINMQANVFEKINGELKIEPMYSKKYVFDNIIVSQFPTVGEIKKVTFQGNGGCIVKGTGDTQCLGTSMQKDYFKGDSLYSLSAGGTPTYAGYLKNSLFIGWSLGSNDRNLLGNEYKVMNDMPVYAQYLAVNQYRLEFQINGDERFNVSGITGEDTMKPYFVEKTSATKPTISSMENNISRFFVQNAVRKNGYRFDYWMDDKGQEVTPNTILDHQYMVLYPHFTALDDGNQEMLSLNFTLDLNNVSAGKDANGVSRMFALYPFNKMDYALEYDKGSDTFSIRQKEILNKELGSMTKLQKGYVLSSKSFSSATSKSPLYLEVNGKRFETFSAFIKASLSDPSHSFSIADIRLNVKMPTFDLGNYYSSSVAKDSLRTDAGMTLDASSASSLFADPASQAAFTFTNNLPFDKTSIQDISDKIASLTHNAGTIYNVGSVSFKNSGITSYDNYTIKGAYTPPKVEHFTDQHITKYDVYITIPLSILNDKYSKRGINIGEVRQWIGTDGDIWISYELRYADNNQSVVDASSDSKNRIIRYNTNLPYRSMIKNDDGYAKDPNGNILFGYTKLRTINFTVDGLRKYNGNNEIFANLSDLHLTQSEVTKNQPSPYLGLTLGEDWIFGGHGKDGWFTQGAVSGGYNGIYTDMYHDDDVWNGIDKPTRVNIRNRDDQYDYARPGDWSNALYKAFERYNPCGNGYQPWIDNGSIWKECLLPWDTTYPGTNRDMFHEDWITTGPDVKTFEYTTTIPGKQEPDIKVISFAANKNQNYLPSFITNVPYKK